MAVVRCRRCGAVVTARGEAGTIETTYGASYRSKCKSPADPAASGLASKAPECPDMDLALRRALFRIDREARAAAPLGGAVSEVR